MDLDTVIVHVLRIVKFLGWLNHGGGRGGICVLIPNMVGTVDQRVKLVAYGR